MCGTMRAMSITKLPTIPDPAPQPEVVSVPTGSDTLSVFYLGLYHDIATYVLSGRMKRKEIADTVGLSQRQLNRIMADSRFREIYNEKHTKLYGSVDAVLENEKADPIIRAHAQAIRGASLLAETVGLLRDRIAEDVKSRSGDETARRMGSMELKTAVEAARVSIDMGPASPRALAAANTGVQVNIYTPSQEQTRILNEAWDESGLDLSDLVDQKLAKGAIDADILQSESNDLADSAIPLSRDAKVSPRMPAGEDGPPISPGDVEAPDDKAAIGAS